jgi:probable F420-dependent oxidoreductase
VRFTTIETMCDPSFMLPLARAAEEAGYDGFGVPDSICYPEESDTEYPYNADGTRQFLDDKPILEPFTLIPAMAAVTENLRFSTFVVKLPIRSPVLVAKQSASIAVLSGNRFSLGVGISPWPEDFRATGVPWERRGKRMDEAVEIVRGLTRGGYFQYHGEIYDIPSIKLCPTPTEPLPILLGGHSEPALRRAARLGDGWMHAGGDPAELTKLLDRLSALRAEYGRDHEPFEIHVISLDAYTPDGVRRLEDQGVTDVIIGFRNTYANEQDTQTLEQKIEALRGYANNVIAKI